MALEEAYDPKEDDIEELGSEGSQAGRTGLSNRPRGRRHLSHQLGVSKVESPSYP